MASIIVLSVSCLLALIGLCLFIFSKNFIGFIITFISVFFGIILFCGSITYKIEIYKPQYIFRSPSNIIIVYNDKDTLVSDKSLAYNANDKDIKIERRLSIYGNVVSNNIILEKNK